MGARRCSIVMGGASPTFNYDYVAHVSARTRPSPSLLLGYVVQGEGLGTRLPKRSLAKLLDRIAIVHVLG